MADLYYNRNTGGEQMTKSALTQIKTTLGRLQSGYQLFDSAGKRILPETGGLPGLPESVLLGASPYTSYNDLLIFAVGTTPAVYLALPNKGGQTADVGLMAAAYIAGITAQREKRALTREEFVRQILLGKTQGVDIGPALEKYRIKTDKNRVVIAVTAQNDIAAFADAIGGALDDQDVELVVKIDRNRAAIIMCVEDEGDYTLLKETAAALADTALELGAGECVLGIGQARQSFSQLSDSYVEALLAIELGKKYHGDQSVFTYGYMFTERFLSEVDENLCKAYHQKLFNEKNKRLFTPEMLRTIRIFMECNLNLSEASRYIYIHRNTLVYRLDKIQAATGLDLRNFDDAATFKFLMQLGSRSAPHGHEE